MSQELRDFWTEVAFTASKSGWVEQVLPAHFALLVSTSGEEPVTMESRAWEGGKFRRVRTTWMHSPARIEVFNLVAYPSTGYATPIFATDIVLFRGQLRIAVVDAMPTRSPAEDPGYTRRWVEPFMDLHGASVANFPRFELRQEWSQHYLGPAACLATGVGSERVGDLRLLWRSYWNRYLELATAEAAAPAAVALEIRGFHETYNREHAEVELKRNPLMRYYGAELGGRFIRDFLFAD